MAFNFPYVLLDEITQSIEPETLVSLVRGARQVVFVGDHKQLKPFVASKQGQLCGLNRSMFERLILLGAAQPIRLNVQYRMHPKLSEFPRDAFYNGDFRDAYCVQNMGRTDVRCVSKVKSTKAFVLKRICSIR